jgi:17beta-estradiol 17-dehydrogenase / very-long-chain 3-oxoacyl-CoA reductase
VLIIPIDFTDGQKVYSVIRAEISHLDVGVLVNNVGIGIQGARFFHTVDEMV